MGDYNSYNEDDYPTDLLRNQFYSSKGHLFSKDLFQPCNHMKLNGWKDLCYSHLLSIAKDPFEYAEDIASIDNTLWNTQFTTPSINRRVTKVNIPLNTTRYGGRIDHAYVSNKFDCEVVGFYKLYDKESDHSPIIVDLYDGYTT